MKNAFMLLRTLSFLWILFLGMEAFAQPAPQALLDQALSQTKTGEIRSAITLLEQAQAQFLSAGNREKAYASGALAAFLKDEEAARKQVPIPANWIKAGWLLADPLYSGSWTTPPIANLPFGGLLLLAREVRRIEFSPGRSIPVWWILDFRVVPVLQKGENFLFSSCQLSGQPDDGLTAIVQVQGREKEEVWKGSRLAWRLNSKTGRIEEVPPSQVGCLNEGLGL